MTNDLLDQYTAILAEIEQLKNQLEDLYSKNSNYVTDGVQASGKTIPFAKHTVLIGGYDVSEDVQDEIDKLVETYKWKIKTLCMARREIEMVLNGIQDPKLRTIIRYKLKGMSWQQIADKLYKIDGKSTEPSVKMYFKRNFPNVTHVTK